MKRSTLFSAVAGLVPMAAVAGNMMVDTGEEMGTHGDPYEGAVLLQECIFEAEEPYCSFIAGGATFYATWEAPTPGYVLEAIGTLYQNAPLMLRADIISLGDVSADIAIHSFELDPDLDWFAETRGFLQGQWMLAANPKYQSHVDGSNVTEYADGQVQSEYVMELAHTCNGANEQGPVLIAWANPWDDPACLILDTVTPEQIRARLVGGDGAQAIYIRP
ncbi:hypothetical protein BXY66_0917 [Shimia isoporae]|uniref:Secreted protein n=1 Tax=Shimia isoporae TaxID=647720 RepID=A0A4R1NKN2_9RHOB|nr:hypothetical protein [Shimia isoporae]TCL08876.1 hypothetical protein BXY66_0917 [Shimia isoporae]